uniref:Uncharacterized protein n=1 Tax=Anguilla anguilla TaxID=7936 RepID=A0A0E9WCP3_ANGAN
MKLSRLFQGQRARKSKTFLFKSVLACGAGHLRNKYYVYL